MKGGGLGSSYIIKPSTKKYKGGDNSDSKNTIEEIKKYNDILFQILIDNDEENVEGVIENIEKLHNFINNKDKLIVSKIKNKDGLSVSKIKNKLEEYEEKLEKYEEKLEKYEEKLEEYEEKIQNDLIYLKYSVYKIKNYISLYNKGFFKEIKETEEKIKETEKEIKETEKKLEKKLEKLGSIEIEKKNIQSTIILKNIENLTIKELEEYSKDKKYNLYIIDERIKNIIGEYTSKDIPSLIKELEELNNDKKKYKNKISSLKKKSTKKKIKKIEKEEEEINKKIKKIEKEEEEINKKIKEKEEEIKQLDKIKIDENRLKKDKKEILKKDKEILVNQYKDKKEILIKKSKIDINKDEVNKFTEKLILIYKNDDAYINSHIVNFKVYIKNTLDTKIEEKEKTSTNTINNILKLIEYYIYELEGIYLTLNKKEYIDVLDKFETFEKIINTSENTIDNSNTIKNTIITLENYKKYKDYYDILKEKFNKVIFYIKYILLLCDYYIFISRDILNIIILFKVIIPTYIRNIICHKFILFNRFLKLEEDDMSIIFTSLQKEDNFILYNFEIIENYNNIIQESGKSIIQERGKSIIQERLKDVKQGVQKGVQKGVQGVQGVQKRIQKRIQGVQNIIKPQNMIESLQTLQIVQTENSKQFDIFGSIIPKEIQGGILDNHELLLL